MKRPTPIPEPVEHEYEPGSPGYNRALQNMYDEGQWSGRGQPVHPDKVVEHVLPDEEDVRHIWRKGDR